MVVSSFDIYIKVNKDFPNYTYIKIDDKIVMDKVELRDAVSFLGLSRCENDAKHISLRSVANDIAYSVMEAEKISRVLEFDKFNNNPERYAECFFLRHGGVDCREQLVQEFARAKNYTRPTKPYFDSPLELSSEGDFIKVKADNVNIAGYRWEKKGIYEKIKDPSVLEDSFDAEVAFSYNDDNEPEVEFRVNNITVLKEKVSYNPNEKIARDLLSIFINEEYKRRYDPFLKIAE